MPTPKIAPKRTTADAVRDAELRSSRAGRIVSISDVQKLTGYDRATVARWISKGMPVSGKGAKGAILVDLRDMLDWREEQARLEERRKILEPAASPVLDPETVFKMEQIKFQQIKTAERVALLVPTSTVKLVIATILNSFRTAIDSLPDRIERDLLDFPVEVVRKTEQDAAAKGRSTARTVVVFLIAAVATLAAGVVLERAGDGIADHIGMSGVLFGATVLAAATSLPELSTGLTSARAGDYQLAISDIFGGNAFLPVLFLLATLISGKAVLPQAQATDIYLAGLAVLLTSVYLAGLIFRPKRRVLGMGIDSLAVLVLYAVGIAGLFAIALLGGQSAG